MREKRKVDEIISPSPPSRSLQTHIFPAKPFVPNRYLSPENSHKKDLNDFLQAYGMDASTFYFAPSVSVGHMMSNVYPPSNREVYPYMNIPMLNPGLPTNVPFYQWSLNNSMPSSAIYHPQAMHMSLSQSADSASLSNGEVAESFPRKDSNE